MTVTQDHLDNHYYSDIYGNTIDGDIGEARVIFRGYNASVKIGRLTTFEENVKVYCEDGVDLSIGDSTIIKMNTKWHF